MAFVSLPTTIGNLTVLGSSVDTNNSLIDPSLLQQLQAVVTNSTISKGSTGGGGSGGGGGDGTLAGGGASGDEDSKRGAGNVVLGAVLGGVLGGALLVGVVVAATILVRNRAAWTPVEHMITRIRSNWASRAGSASAGPPLPFPLPSPAGPANLAGARVSPAPSASGAANALAQGVDWQTNALAMGSPGGPTNRLAPVTGSPSMGVAYPQPALGAWAHAATGRNSLPRLNMPGRSDGGGADGTQMARTGSPELPMPPPPGSPYSGNVMVGGGSSPAPAVGTGQSFRLPGAPSLHRV
jgi:hypothetical protein